MKKLFTLIATILIVAGSSLAQAPDMINYQAAARDGSGNILANQSINVTFKIHAGSAGGTVIFEEDHSGVTTNDFGLFSLQIGGGTNVSGSIGGADWGTDSHWLEVEVNGASMGTQQLVSVPYALEAGGPWERAGSNVVFEGGNVGIGTNNPQRVLDIQGSGSLYVGLTSSGSALTGLELLRPGSGFYDWRVTNIGGRLQFNVDNDEFSGGAGTTLVSLDFDDNVGIGEGNPSSNLHLQQTDYGSFTTPNNAGLAFYNHFNANYWTVYNSSPFLSFAYLNNRVGYVSNSNGTWNATSDGRLKNRVQDMYSALDKLKQLRPVSYFYNDREMDKPTIGFIAQDVEPLFPEVVSKDPGEDGYYGIAYGQMSVIAIKAIQEQQIIIESMQAQINVLQKELEALKK